MESDLKSFKRKKRLKKVLKWLFALIMMITGILHFIKPGAYAAFIPDWLPLLFTNYVVGLVEAGIGVGLLIKKSSGFAAICLVLLMLFFLPFHVFDAFKSHPAIGSPLVAWIRLPVQFLLIYWAYYLRRQNRP